MIHDGMPSLDIPVTPQPPALPAFTNLVITLHVRTVSKCATQISIKIDAFQIGLQIKKKDKLH